MRSKIEVSPDVLLESVPFPVLILESNLRIIAGNEAFFRLFRLRPEMVEKRFFWEIDRSQWENPDLKTQLERVAREGLPVDSFELEQIINGTGRRTLLLRARPLFGNKTGSHDIALLFEDI